LIDDLTALAFTVSENKGVFALLLGSGLSRSAGIPTGWEITLDLIRRLAAASKVPKQPDWGVWYEQEFGRPPNYSELLGQLGLTASERRTFLHTYIDPTPEEAKAGKKRPTAAHRAVARLARDGHVRMIITTNFDRLIENAIREEGIEPTVIKSTDDLKGAVPLVHSRCTVLKLHGDYLDARILNTELELSKYPPEIDAYLDRVIDEFGLIVCGWSGEWDQALRSAILRAPNRRYPMFFAARSKPSDVAAELTTRRGGKVILIKDADSFFEDLDQQVALIEEANKPNPQSVALIVERAKQIVGKSHHKVDQTELLGENLRAALMLKASNAPNHQLSNDEFGLIVARAEALAEPVSRILGIWGRYGDGSELDQALETITTLSAFVVRAGVVTILELQRYPGMLVLYGYGLGALKAQRFDVVFRLFCQSVESLQGDRNAVVVDDFFLITWEGQRLPWVTVNKAVTTKPLSDHLEGLFNRWTRDYIYDEKDFEFQFALFEALGAITHLTLHYNAGEIRAALANQQFGQNFRFAPHALLGRDSTRRTAVLQWLIRPESQQKLLAAGFGRSDEDHFTATIDNLKRLWATVGYVG
jgi:SIR2-like domain